MSSVSGRRVDVPALRREGTDVRIRESINEMVDSGSMNNEVVYVDEFLEMMRERWGDLDDDCGCYVNGEWLSVNEVARMMVLNCSPG